MQVVSARGDEPSRRREVRTRVGGDHLLHLDERSNLGDRVAVRPGRERQRGAETNLVAAQLVPYPEVRRLQVGEAGQSLQCLLERGRGEQPV